jgi:hypothetical protein
MAGFSNAAQVVAFTVGGLYALGLLIVNVELSLYGIVHLELARPEYIMAGALWVVIVLAPVAVSVRGALNAWNFFQQGNFTGLSLAIIAIVLAGFLTPLGMMQVFSSPTEGERLALICRHLFVIAISIGAAAVSILPALIFGPSAFSTDGDWRFWSLSIVSTLSALVLSVVLMIWFYAALAFPDMNRAFGGGRKPVVQIVLRQPAPASWEVTGMPIKPDGASVGPVLLVLQRSDAVVVSPIAPTNQPWYRPRRHGSTTAIAQELISVVHYKTQLPHPL